MTASSNFFLRTGIGAFATYVVVTSTAIANDLPRYRLKVGQELVYEETANEDLQPKTEEEKKTDSVYETKLKWWVWVTRQNDDGGWRVLLRKRIDSFVTPPGGTRQPRFENDILGHCDLAADGAFAANPSIDGHPYFKPFPGDLFVQLPSNKEALAGGWSFSSPIRETKASFKIAKREGDRVLFTGSFTNPTDWNYQSKDTQEIEFDVERGVITKIVNESKAEWKVNPWHTRHTIELKAANEHDAAWAATIAAEGDSYLAARQKSDALINKADHTRTKAECQALIDEARKLFLECQAKSNVPEIRSIVDAGLKRFDVEAKGEVESATKREELYAKPAVDWETTDLDGKPQKLVDYRGRIVLLDFWYRGCGHCIDALPKVKKLVTHYEGKNVVVLGVNNDEDLSNARFVIDSFQLKHNNIHAGEIPKQYRVNAWPTFIVLDQTGRMADYHEGNSNDLYERISGVVDKLLDAPATAQ